MTTVVGANNTYAQIEVLVRRFTASPKENTLKSVVIQETVNSVYNQDFPAAIKVDQMRDIYTFFTEPYIDSYPLDVNYNQGVRDPVYIDGIRGTLTKDRGTFYNIWPPYPTNFNSGTGDGVTQAFSFSLGPIPILRNMVTIGSTSTSGSAISISDDGYGNLQLQTPNPVISVPSQTTYPSVPGMYNRNTRNPGLYNVQTVGTVNYISGAVAFNLAPVSVTPAAGQPIKSRASQYQTGLPYCVLFWNNTFTIRPIPKYIHRITVETYLTPVQFMLTTDSPILNQWVTYIALLASVKILRERQDMLGVQNLMPYLKEQEGLVLERQAVEEIGQKNVTIYNTSGQQSGWNLNNWGYW